MRVVCVLVMAAGMGLAADKPDGGRAVAGKEVVTLGGVTVAVDQVGLFPTFWRQVGERREQTDGQRGLCLTLKVSTNDATKKVNYTAWRHVAGVKAVDKFGNGYEVKREQSGQTFADSVERKAVVSKGQPTADRVYFEAPIGAADYIDVDLPGEAVGVKGEVFRFRVPRAAWEPAPEKKGPAKPKKK